MQKIKGKRVKISIFMLGLGMIFFPVCRERACSERKACKI